MKTQLGKTMIATGLRGSIERILGGDVRAEDLHTLFFSIRQESGGKGIVSEIAHFIAHPEPRTQGITRDELRDLYAFMKFRAQLNSPLKMTDIPATVPEALRANLRRTRASTLKRETRTNPTHAKRVLDRILARVGPTGSGGLSKLAIIDAEELALLKLLGSRVRAGPLFTEQDLMKDLSHALQKRSLLKQTEYSGLIAQKAPISIFALTAMHNHQIELGDGTTAVLAVVPDKLGNLAIFGFADIVGFLMPGEITTVGHCCSKQTFRLPAIASKAWRQMSETGSSGILSLPLKVRLGAFNRGDGLCFLVQQRPSHDTQALRQY